VPARGPSPHLINLVAVLVGFILAALIPSYTVARWSDPVTLRPGTLAAVITLSALVGIGAVYTLHEASRVIARRYAEHHQQ